MVEGNRLNYRQCACLCADGIKCTAHAHQEKKGGPLVGMRECPFAKGMNYYCLDYYTIKY